MLKQEGGLSSVNFLQQEKGDCHQSTSCNRGKGEGGIWMLKLWTAVSQKLFNYRLGTVNSNTVNPKFHLKSNFLSEPIISCLRDNSNEATIQRDKSKKFVIQSFNSKKFVI